uniref:Uncharacterized protein n=1 Tax=Cacopsylla melanoneura TaxID=428564 RepID=A0A8D8Z650_9HEMI
MFFLLLYYIPIESFILISQFPPTRPLPILCLLSRSLVHRIPPSPSPPSLSLSPHLLHLVTPIPFSLLPSFTPLSSSFFISSSHSFLSSTPLFLLEIQWKLMMKIETQFTARKKICSSVKKS